MLGSLKANWRFQRKLPTTSSDVHWSDIIIGCFRTRDWEHPEPAEEHLLRRFVHSFCQQVEVGVEPSLQESCPDPNFASSSIHPFSKSSRAQGNPSLKQSLVSRFCSRGGGYVTTKHDPKLKELGIISDKSNVASRTCLEYCSRILVKTAQQCSTMSYRRVINIAFDGASISEEQVPCLVGR